jgi:phage portal protein BeeE
MTLIRAVADGLFARSRQTAPTRIPPQSLSVMYNNTDRFKQGKPNARLFRHWAEHSEWVRAAVNIRKTQVSQAEWGIGPYDATKWHDQALADYLTGLFRAPNPATESFRGFIEPIIEDLLVLDAGVVEKEFNLNGMVGRLWGVDGATIKVSTIWDGEDDAEPRYFWYPDHQLRASLTNRELVYMMDNPATYRVVGLAPLETLKLAIDSELGSSAYNDRQMRAPTPDGMLDLGENARPDQVEKFKNFWRSEVAGMGALAIVGGTKNAKFLQFRQNNRDAQFMEWQEYLVRKIAAVFKLSPQDLMLERDVNRSTSEVQQENTEDRGLRPMLGLVSDYFTREVVWDPAFGGEKNNLAFQFTALNLKESMTRAQINRYATGGLSWKTPNEARRDDGRPPIGDPNDESNPMNKVLVNASRGLVAVEDVPTAREYLDATSKPAPTSDGSPPSKTNKGTELPLVAEGLPEDEQTWLPALASGSIPGLQQVLNLPQ